ncbi:uncharacterized protein LOC108655515 [Drosophila navojoa]|uniref:uncharacterized protein LOC108655515 n=1 Tax=Drosophila navojoa TaxID=7232 RepID=UPI0011BE3DB0|nr:uncharacterized protein LOC108655515 [Drosophila navojoa]
MDNSSMAASTMTSDDIKSSSPIKSGSQRRPKSKKNASTCTNTNEVGTLTNATGDSSMLSVMEIESNSKKSPTTCSSPKTHCSSSEKQDVHIINERNGLNYQKNNAAMQDEDEDSESEKLSPLLSSGTQSKNSSNKSVKLVLDSIDTSDNEDMVTNDLVNDTVVSVNIDGDDISTKHNVHGLDRTDANGPLKDPGILATNLSAEDSDYYTPDDIQSNILSPLYSSERVKSGDSLCCSCAALSHGNCDMNVLNAAGIDFNAMVKRNQNLKKKSTSAGNIVGPKSVAPASTGVDLKSNNVSSLPDMLDSPASGNSASTRSSSDSYSSSSSTKQLLSSNTTTAAANIIVDDKSSLQNAVNV